MLNGMNQPAAHTHPLLARMVALKPGETRASRLVVIGEKGLDRDAIAAALTRP